MANGWRRSGTLAFALMVLVAVCLLLAVAPLFVGCFLLGLYAFREASSVHLLYAWDVVALAFAAWWGIGLAMDLQRTESLAVSKFLHLPVSLQGVFALNYVSSLFNSSIILFLPAMFGLGLGLACDKGGRLLVALPLSAAFLLMVTAVTYQFQGWLASLMSNPRRRRNVIVVVTACFVLVAQVPSLIHFLAPWGPRRIANQAAEFTEQTKQLEREFQERKINADERARRELQLSQQYQRDTNQTLRETLRLWQQAVLIMNWLLPIGWLALGVKGAAEGNLAAACFGFAGMASIGAASLWRAYRTTIRIYRGDFNAQGGRAMPTVVQRAVDPWKGTKLLERRIPYVSEPASAVALAGLRSLWRAPEAKIMLLTPVLLSVVFGGVIWNQPSVLPGFVRPLMAIGSIVMVLFSMLQLMANQFGFDRDGFRVLVLSAASRRDILLGKNMAFAPLAAGMAAVLLTALQIVSPMRLDHLLAMPPQFVSMYLLYCILVNALSIYLPMRIAAGSLKPAQPTSITILLQMAAFMFLFPLMQAPTLIPLGAEAALAGLGWIDRAPIYLLLALGECAAIVCLYRRALHWQGHQLQGREQSILETVTNRAS
jgi:hypothetical protein